MTKYGAYSPKKIYTVEDMVDLVEYGRVRGVKVVPELDAPAHSGNGWNWGPENGKGEMALCVNKGTSFIDRSKLLSLRIAQPFLLQSATF